MNTIRAFDCVHKTAHWIIDNLEIKIGARILDVAAGNGDLTQWLNKKSFEVIPVDIDSSNWICTDIDCHNHDLNAPLPFEDESFDLIVSLETIEHLDAPYHFIRELARILRPAGTLIISTPNPNSFKSRIKYLFVGLPALFDFTPGYGNFGGHISPVSIGHFLWAFDENKIEFKDVFSCGPDQGIIRNLLEYPLRSLLIAITKYLKKLYIGENRHYLNRLSKQQLKKLTDGLILFVIGTKIK